MFSRRQQRQRAILAGIVVLGLLLGAWLVNGGMLDTTLQAAVYDYAITSSPAKVRNQITIVALDEKSIQRYQRYPLPRSVYAELVTALKKANVAVIGFDVGFYDQTDRPEDDRAFAAAMKDAGNVILAVQGNSGQAQGDRLVRYATINQPVPVLREAASALAAVNIFPDPDGRARDSQLRIAGPDGTIYYSLPLMAVARALRADPKDIRVEGDRLVLPTRLGAKSMPLDQRGGMAVYFASEPAPAPATQKEPCKRPGEFCVVSIADVIAGTVPTNLLTGRTVLVGAHSLDAAADDYPVPNSSSTKMWGVEIWANAAQSIFTNRYPVIKQSLPATLLTIAVFLAGGIFLVVRFRLFGFLGALGLLAAYSIGSVVLFGNGAGDPLGNGPVEAPSIGYVSLSAFWWVVALGYLLVEEQRSVARTQATFGRFVTPSVARTIMDREESGSLGLGGEEKQVTVLFGDIRGFTTISEGMAPSTLLNTLNRYFEGIVDVVNRFDGTVNKYNGDNIMVIWNAPLPVADHARKAVTCALEIQRWIVAERAKGGPDVSFGFGINSGPVVAGFLGAKGRMEYTVIGDTANVASRLTSADIARRDQVAVSGATLEALGDGALAVDLGAITVKGRAGAVRCWQIDRLGEVASPNPAPAPEHPIGAAAVGGFH